LFRGKIQSSRSVFKSIHRILPDSSKEKRKKFFLTKKKFKMALTFFAAFMLKLVQLRKKKRQLLMPSSGERKIWKSFFEESLLKHIIFCIAVFSFGVI